MKIGVLGKGTASAISLMTMISVMVRNNVKAEITCISDPNIPITHVGESMTPVIMALLHDVAKFNPCEDMELLDATYRWATKYFWKEANDNEFYVRYQESGLHANSEKFAPFVIQRLSENYEFFKSVDDKILSVENQKDSVIVKGEKQDYEFDFVIDVTGTPSAEDLNNSALYKPAEFESVNSVLLYQDFTKYDEMYTSAYVHKNGWMFGVPLQHRKAFGYLYNNKFTTKEEAIEDFSRLKGIDASKCRAIEWKQYSRRKIMNGRVVTLGNRMYFFEPHQAIPLHYYYLTADFFMFILAKLSEVGKINIEMNTWHDTSLEYIQDLIAMNYAGENRIDSPFWNYARDASRKHLKHSYNWKKFIETSRSQGMMANYWIHAPSMMIEYLRGLGINTGDY
jgi:Tryptophan halogenase